MKLSKPQAQVAFSTARFKCLVTGRRWGKTTLMIRELARFARWPDRRVMYVAPTYGMAKQICWQPLLERLTELNWIESVNKSELTITLVNGSIIMLRSADNPDSMRGLGLDFVAIDEAADISKETWTEVLRPTLSDREGHALIAGTPKGMSNSLYDFYVNAKQLPNWESWQFTTLDGGNVSEAELADARRDLDERTFRQEYLGNFETYQGIIYYNFGDHNIAPYKEEVGNQIFLWLDFNVSPMSAVVAVRTGWGYHIIDEIVIYNSNTAEMVEEVKNRYPNKRVTAMPDPAGAQRKTSAGGLTDIKILQNAGFSVKYRKAHPAVKDRINAVNSALLSTSGDIRLKIDPKCKKAIESLRKMAFKEGTVIPDKDSGYDHLTDSIGYGVEFLMPVVKYDNDDATSGFSFY